MSWRREGIEPCRERSKLPASPREAKRRIGSGYRPILGSSLIIHLGVSSPQSGCVGSSQVDISEPSAAKLEEKPYSGVTSPARLLNGSSQGEFFSVKVGSGVCRSLRLFISRVNEIGLFSWSAIVLSGRMGLDCTPLRLFAGAVTSKRILLDDPAALGPWDLGVKNRVNFRGVIDVNRFSFELSPWAAILQSLLLSVLCCRRSLYVYSRRIIYSSSVCQGQGRRVRAGGLAGGGGLMEAIRGDFVHESKTRRVPYLLSATRRSF